MKRKLKQAKTTVTYNKTVNKYIRMSCQEQKTNQYNQLIEMTIVYIAVPILLYCYNNCYMKADSSITWTNVAKSTSRSISISVARMLPLDLPVFLKKCNLI